mmetsp:Transcript_167726/g.538657  ORF Transcript_167726/g.538657 Transcript_167726/m.538657 type:complete len:485 (-) Transcript_167726:286-1740(-)
MGQQTSASFTPFTAWKKKETEADLEQLAFRLRQTEAMLADPDKLARDCDFHFGRAGLDARGELRRVELRRLLWTFAHSLGSSDLTWEAIEASAVIGTVEPHVPSVTQDQFFRCTLKTVHLVAAELRDKHREMEGRIRLQYARQHGDLRSAGPWVGQKQGSPPSPSASSRGSSVSRGSSASSRGSRGSPHGAGPEREAQPPTMAFPSKGKGRGKISQMGAGLGKGAPAAPYDFEVADAGPMVLLRGEAAEPSMLSRSPDESTEPRPAPAFDPPSAASPSPSPTGAPREPRLAPVFAPPPPSAAAAAAPPEWRAPAPNIFAPAGGAYDEAQEFGDSLACIGAGCAHALLLNSEGGLDPQEMLIENGILVLTEPLEEEPSLTQRLWGSDRRSSSFDLSLVESALSGEALLRSPAAAMLPDLSEPGEASAFDRMLVLIFPGGEALCLLFSDAKVCADFAQAAIAEATCAGGGGRDGSVGFGGYGGQGL